MTYGSCYAFVAPVIYGYHSAVAERKLQFALTLLACHLSGDGTVYLVGQPILAGHSLQAQHFLQIFVDMGCVIFRIGVSMMHCHIFHICLGRTAEHLRHRQVKRSFPVCLFKHETMIARSLAHYIHGRPLAVGYLLHMFYGIFPDEESHPLLRFVGYDFLCRQRLVAYRQFVHFHYAAAVFHQFRQAVHMSCRTVVMYGDYGVAVLLAQCTHHIVGTFLHFGIGPLHGIEFYAAGIASGVYG